MNFDFSSSFSSIISSIIIIMIISYTLNALNPLTALTNLIQNTYIPLKRACDPNERDDGVSCWLDTYGVGVGRIPDKAPCDSGQRDDGTSCWEDLKCNTVDNGFYNTSWGSVGCTDGRPFIFSGYDDCYKTWIAKLSTTCVGCGCIKKTAFDRYQCNSDEYLNGALCYPKCKSGYENVGALLCQPIGGPGIKKTLMDRQYCNSKDQLKAGLCYKS